MQLLAEPVRRLAAWCAVILLVAGVVCIGIQVCVVLRPAVVPVLLALLGTALLLPLHRWLMKAKANRSVAAGLTCAAVLAMVGGAVWGVVVLVPIGRGGLGGATRAARVLDGREYWESLSCAPSLVLSADLRLDALSC